MYVPHLSTLQSPEAVSPFPLSPQTPSTLPLPAPFHQSLSTFPTFHPQSKMDCPSCHPQPVPPNRCKGPAPTTLLSLLHHQSSFFHSDLLQLYITMLLPLPAEKTSKNTLVLQTERKDLWTQWGGREWDQLRQ